MIYVDNNVNEIGLVQLTFQKDRVADIARVRRLLKNRCDQGSICQIRLR